MFFMPLTVITQEIYKDFSVSLDKKDWAVVCLCAEWCGTCRGYSKHFEEFAQRHGDKTVAWLDIEDNSELLGDFFGQECECGHLNCFILEFIFTLSEEFLISMGSTVKDRR